MTKYEKLELVFLEAHTLVRAMKLLHGWRGARIHSFVPENCLFP